MQMLLVMLGALLSPLLGLGLLLWLAHLEDTLDRDVDAARRHPAPAPILAIPLRTPSVAGQRVALPEQRAGSGVLALRHALLGRQHEPVADVAHGPDQGLVLRTELGS
jgi:hypothetical protein